MSIHSFCSENINEAVSIMGKGVGVGFVSKKTVESNTVNT